VQQVDRDLPSRVEIRTLLLEAAVQQVDRDFRAATSRAAEAQTAVPLQRYGVSVSV
jgi:hypothetical protein